MNRKSQHSISRNYMKNLKTLEHFTTKAHLNIIFLNKKALQGNDFLISTDNKFTIIKHHYSRDCKEIVTLKKPYT